MPTGQVKQIQVQVGLYRLQPSTLPIAAGATLSQSASATYYGSVALTVTPPGGSTVYYTLDGSDPTSSGTRTGITTAAGLTFTTTTTIKVYTVASGFANSAVTTATYTVLPVARASRRPVRPLAPMPRRKTWPSRRRRARA